MHLFNGVDGFIELQYVIMINYIFNNRNTTNHSSISPLYDIYLKNSSFEDGYSWHCVTPIVPKISYSKPNRKPKVDTKTEEPEVETKLDSDPNDFQPNVLDIKSNLDLHCING